jgi:flagellar hook-basal body complex protein FliE
MALNFDVTRALRLDRGPSEFGAGNATPLKPGPSFQDALKSTLDEVSRLDQVANVQVQAMAQGKPVEPHELMMAVEQANLALDLLIEVRNRLLEGYQELSRTQI